MSRAGSGTNDNHVSIIVEPKAENLPTDRLAQVLFDEITGRQNSITELGTKCFILEVEDIRQLNIKLDQMFGRHTVLSKAFSVEMSLSNGQEVALHSWDDFSNFDCSQSELFEKLL
jgi:hypothetical protein